MGNCIPGLMSHEPKRPKSKSRGCVVPLNHADGHPIKEDGDADDHSIKEDGGSKKGVIRIKMVMTKKEVAMLLAKLSGDCTDEESSIAENIEQIARELGRSKAGRRLSTACRDPWRPALESIPENC